MSDTARETVAADLAAAEATLPAGSRRAFGSAAVEAAAAVIVRYLDAYGYLPDTPDKYLPSVVRRGVADAQEFFGVPATGVADRAVYAAATLPRCGCPDLMVPPGSPYALVRSAAFTRFGRWGKSPVVFAVRGTPPGVTREAMEAALRSAFALWTDGVSLELELGTDCGSADVVVASARGRENGLDGPSGVLAWADMPDGKDGQLRMVFDEDETWVTSSGERGILLDNVVRHEMGHVLGLDHSRVTTALMAPHYNPLCDRPRRDDDVVRMQARYGVGPYRQAAEVVLTGRIDSLTIDGRKVYLKE